MKTMNIIQVSKRLILVVFSLTVISTFTSCSGDDDGDTPMEPDPVVEINYGVSVVAGSSGMRTSYLQGLTDLEVSTIDNTDATELGGFSTISTDGKNLFAAAFGAPATMTKYKFDDQGKAVYDEAIIVPGANSFSTIEIVNETTGFATVGGGVYKVVEFNPETMRITGEIDISEPGNFFYSDMIVRDNTLFVALNDFGGADSSKIAVVDLNTRTLDKVIKDGRTGTLFGNLVSEILTTDEEGNIYVNAFGLSQFSSGNKPAAILKINAGETDFDPEYLFNLTETTGKSCFGVYYLGDGMAITTTVEDESQFFFEPVFRYRKINLSEKTDLGEIATDLPNSSAPYFKQDSDDEFLFPIAGSDEDALYRYTISTGEVSKVLNSTGGQITGFVKLD